MSNANPEEQAVLVEYLPEQLQNRTVPVVRSLQVTPVPRQASVVLVFAYYQDSPEASETSVQDF